MVKQPTAHPRLTRLITLLSTIALALLGVTVLTTPAHADVEWDSAECGAENFWVEIVVRPPAADFSATVNGSTVTWELGVATYRPWILPDPETGEPLDAWLHVLLFKPALPGDGPWTVVLFDGETVIDSKTFCGEPPTSTPTETTTSTPTETTTSKPTSTPTETTTSKPTSTPTKTATSKPTTTSKPTSTEAPTKPAPKPTHQVPSKVQTDGGVNTTLVGIGLLGMLTAGFGLARRSRREH